MDKEKNIRGHIKTEGFETILAVMQNILSLIRVGEKTHAELDYDPEKDWIEIKVQSDNAQAPGKLPVGFSLYQSNEQK